MNIEQNSSFCNLTYLIWGGKFARSIDDSASTIGVLNFKTITMYMKKVVKRNEKKAASWVDAARK